MSTELNAKCTKVCKEGTKKTREDMRQKARILKLEEEAARVYAKMKPMISLSKLEKFNKMPDIDRNIFMVLFSAMETYLTALNMKTQWELSRVRTASGAPLTNDFLDFWEFLFGDTEPIKVVSEEDLVDKPCKKPCKKTCKKECKKTCKKECKKPCKKIEDDKLIVARVNL